MHLLERKLTRAYARSDTTPELTCAGSDNPDAMITFIPGGESAMGNMYNYDILRKLATSRGGISLTMEVCASTCRQLYRRDHRVVSTNTAQCVCVH